MLLNNDQITFLARESSVIQERGYIPSPLDISDIKYLMESDINELYGLAYDIWQVYDNNQDSIRRNGFRYRGNRDKFAYEIVKTIIRAIDGKDIYEMLDVDEYHDEYFDEYIANNIIRHNNRT